ncbi:MAG: AMP-binding protein [Clostridia bacterium]|nr:AMP-binding protein [Clostridia bacterium]
MEIIKWLKNGDPEKILFSDENNAVTYADFRETAQRIGSALISRCNVTRKPIVVFIDRNIQSICALFGIVFSGNFYVPVDVNQPTDRIKTIFRQIQPAAAIRLSGIPEIEEEVREFCSILDYNEISSAPIDSQALCRIQENALDTDPLYAICTSGSTGVPKAVLISHRSVVDFIPVFVNTFHFSKEEIFGNQAPFDFDVSTKDIYSALYCGAQMHIIPRVCFSMPKQLIDFLNERKISAIIWAVSAVCIPSGFNSFKYDIPHHLKKVLFSGEQMPMKQLNIWRKYMPEVEYVNLYGPTEITCNCMYYVVDRSFEDTEVLPLGKAFANEHVMVIKEDGTPIKQGETGEICVRGTCLALGYYNAPDRTALAFTQTPEHNSYPELIYHTGDLAYLNERNEYVFASRKDFQIKHMGHRIELGEIETYASVIESIRMCCCIYDETKNKIVLFYDGNAEKKEVVNQLKEKLPKYMLPNVYMQLETMPLNKNGKIDRQKLRSMLNHA